MLQASHALIAMQRDEAHWMLDDADAKRYGIAVQNALRHVPIKVAQKSIDFTALVAAIVQIETPRIALSARLAKQRAQGQRRGPAQVFQFHPQPGTERPGPTPPANPGAPSQPPGAGGPQPPVADGPMDGPTGFDVTGGDGYPQ